MFEFKNGDKVRIREMTIKEIHGIAKSDDEVIDWANENLDGFEWSKTSSRIVYPVGSYNLMNIYEI